MVRKKLISFFYPVPEQLYPQTMTWIIMQPPTMPNYQEIISPVTHTNLNGGSSQEETLQDHQTKVSHK